MPDYRLKLAMSQGGRGSRDTHSVVFRVAPEGAFTRAAAKQLGLDLAAALAVVTFQTTNFLRATFTELDANSRSVRYSSFSVPLSETGNAAYDVGDGSTAEQVCLAIEKAAQLGKPGITYLRHVLSAQEYADYLNAGTIPPRFSVSPVGQYGAGDSLTENIAKAFNDNNFVMKLPPLSVNGFVTERVVETIAAQDFRIIKATKTRTSPMNQIAEGVQRQLNEWARQAWRMWNRYTQGNHPANVLAAIAAIVSAAWDTYNALQAAERILVRPPSFPMLPGA